DAGEQTPLIKRSGCYGHSRKRGQRSVGASCPPSKYEPLEPFVTESNLLAPMACNCTGDVTATATPSSPSRGHLRLGVRCDSSGASLRSGLALNSTSSPCRLLRGRPRRRNRVLEVFGKRLERSATHRRSEPSNAYTARSTLRSICQPSRGMGGSDRCRSKCCCRGDDKLRNGGPRFLSPRQRSRSHHPVRREARAQRRHRDDRLGRRMDRSVPRPSQARAADDPYQPL